MMVLLSTLHASCRVGLVTTVEYPIRPLVVGPLGSRVTDGTKGFAEMFCAVLPHTDSGKWGDCARYLETQTAPQPPVSGPVTTRLKVMIVGGAFSECFEKHDLFVFDNSLDHLRYHGVQFGRRLSVGGTTTPEVNAHAIAEYLTNNPGEYIAIGHSKGAVDLMAAIQHYRIAQTSIKALVSVASPIAGSRLADLGVTLGILGFRDAVRKSGLGNCHIVDDGGILSLRRDVRARALRAWHPPQTLRSYSLVGVSSYARTSTPLHVLWKRNSYYSIDQDSHIIAEEGIIPGAEFLGVAQGDHWALALPMSEHLLTKKKVDQNTLTIGRIGGLPTGGLPTVTEDPLSGAGSGRPSRGAG